MRVATGGGNEMLLFITLKPNSEAFSELVATSVARRNFRSKGVASRYSNSSQLCLAFPPNEEFTNHSSLLVFNAKADEFEFCIKRQNSVNQDTFVKLRGLPFSCKQEDVQEFFEGKREPCRLCRVCKSLLKASK